MLIYWIFLELTGRPIPVWLQPHYFYPNWTFVLAILALTAGCVVFIASVLDRDKFLYNTGLVFIGCLLLLVAFGVWGILGAVAILILFYGLKAAIQGFRYFYPKN